MIIIFRWLNYHKLSLNSYQSNLLYRNNQITTEKVNNSNKVCTNFLGSIYTNNNKQVRKKYSVIFPQIFKNYLISKSNKTNFYKELKAPKLITCDSVYFPSHFQTSNSHFTKGIIIFKFITEEVTNLKLRSNERRDQANGQSRRKSLYVFNNNYRRRDFHNLLEAVRKREKKKVK